MINYDLMLNVEINVQSQTFNYFFLFPEWSGESGESGCLRANSDVREKVSDSI